MKKLTLLLLTALLTIPAWCANSTITDVYDLKLRLYVPRTYNNEQSLGYRKYQVQKVTGQLKLTYTSEFERPIVEVTNLVNATHKMSNGRYVTYTTIVDSDSVYPRFNVIGSNKTGVFKTPAVIFALDAEPVYNLGDDDEDNSLLITLSGTGTTSTSIVKGARILKSMKGNVTGTLGCGCKAYGHKSATRLIGPFGLLYYLPDESSSFVINPLYTFCAPAGCEEAVDDVAAIWGTWTAKYNKNLSRK